MALVAFISNPKDVFEHNAKPEFDEVAILDIDGGDEDRAVLLDINLRIRIVDDLFDHLAARPNDVADLVDVNVHGRDPRRIRREIRRRFSDALQHFPHDEGAAALRLFKRRGENFPGNPGNFDIHLNRRNALLCPGDFEIHIAEGVFHTLNIGQNSVLIAVFDEPHRYARNRPPNGNAGIHQGQRAAADASHRARAVRFENL